MNPPVSGNVSAASKDTRGWFFGHFVLLFPKREVALKQEGDFVLFGPDVPHSFRSEQESLVLTVRWPSQPPGR